MRFGAQGHAAHPALILLIPPLFDEANRLRRTLVLAMRELSRLGFDCALPDLPGQNDSLVPTEAVSLSLWQEALTAIVTETRRPVVSAAWRAGCLLDAQTPLAGRWRMAPIAGASVLRTLARAKIAGEKEAGRDLSLDSLLDRMRHETTEVAGNRLSPAMTRELESATIADALPLRTVAVGSAAGALPGSPLWLRAEPGEDTGMAMAMAADIAAWARQCVAG